jgi:hypothetical protein
MRRSWRLECTLREQRSLKFKTRSTGSSGPDLSGKCKLRATTFLLLIFLAAAPAASGAAQAPVTAIDTLDVEIWPDYDRPSVLVLLTGALPAGTTFPASVTLDLPEGARVNAVARIDSENGTMTDDIFSSAEISDMLNFTTPDPRFRVEYYVPYTADDMQRSFDYTWPAQIPVKSFHLRVQRPAPASALRTEPAADDERKSSDGFEYHIFSARAVPAGQPFSLHVVYTMDSARLSAESIPSPGAVAPSTAQQGGPGTGTGFNWALVAMVAGGVLFIGALVWQIAARREASRCGPRVQGANRAPG